MNLKNVLVLILAGGKGDRLEPLTRHRTKPAVPFGGVYRIIDFTLSNAINSDLRKIVILVQYKCISLNRHIREGWNIFSSALGEYIEPVSPQQRITDTWYLGTADAVYQNLYSVDKENPEHVLILAGDHIYKMDYRHMLNLHKERGADITVGVVEVPKSESSRYGIIQLGDDQRIIGFQEKPQENPATLPHNPNMCLASMGIYVFSTRILYEMLQADSTDANSSHDFGRDIIPKALKNLKVYGFNFIDENKKEAKYWRDVGSIDAYYQASMDLIAVSPIFNLYDQAWPIRTYQIQAPPPKFIFAQEGPGGRMGIALDSIVCQGCVISGGRIQNAVLSPNVRVNSYAQVYQSILFEGVEIGRHAKIKKAIIDKDVKIPEGVEIGYDLEADARRFTVSEGGVVVIAKGERL
jgi:glucose-1-phosphate adenylyltransferase